MMSSWIINNKLFKIKSKRCLKLYFVLHNIKFSRELLFNFLSTFGLSLLFTVITLKYCTYLFVSLYSTQLSFHALQVLTSNSFLKCLSHIPFIIPFVIFYYFIRNTWMLFFLQLTLSNIFVNYMIIIKYIFYFTL
jgi:hypothetical protein